MPEIFYSDYTKGIENSISTNIKSFWSYISNSLINTHVVSYQNTMDNRESESAEDLYELFTDYFSSVFNVDSPQIPYFDFGWTFKISQCNITTTDIQQRLKTP